MDNRSHRIQLKNCPPPAFKRGGYDSKKAGYYKDADGYRKRWEELVYYSKCGRFRKEYHVRADKEEYYFQLKASDGQDQEDMMEFGSFTELLENYEEDDNQPQLDL